MSTIEYNLLQQVNTNGKYQFTTRYQKKNNRYVGIRTSKAAKKLFDEGLINLHVEYKGLTKHYTLTRI